VQAVVDSDDIRDLYELYDSYAESLRSRARKQN
jgi:hypothetical protein